MQDVNPEEEAQLIADFNEESGELLISYALPGEEKTEIGRFLWVEIQPDGLAKPSDDDLRKILEAVLEGLLNEELPTVIDLGEDDVPTDND